MKKSYPSPFLPTFVTNQLHNMRRDVFQAIADPNRRAIIGLLTSKPLTLNEIADHFPVSRPAISRHVKILSECGLIAITTHGRQRHCEARLQPLKQVADWSEQYRKFWSSKLDALEDFLAKSQNPKTPARKPKTRNN